MTGTRITLALLAGLCLLPSQVQAQDDPFEAILGDSASNATAPLNEIGIPLQNPTEDELRQYLEAFRTVNLSSDFTIDDGSGRRANVGPATGFGAFKARNGTRVHLAAKFARPRGKREAILSELEFRPSRPMSMGPLRFKRMSMDSKGVLHFKLNLEMMGVDFWPQELTVEKIYKDRKGNLVFKTGGSGLAGAFVPDMRIKPDGTVQRWDKGWWFFGRHGAGWKNVKERGKTVKLADTLPITHWPPRATDIMDWLPREGAAGTQPVRDGLNALVPFLDSVPITDISTRFRARAGRKRIKLSRGHGDLCLVSQEIDLVSHGRFRGRTYETDTRRENRFKVTTSVSGKVGEKGLGEATIKSGKVVVNGTFDATIPWSDLDEVDVKADYTGSTHARLARIRARVPGGGVVDAKDVRLAARGSGRVHLKPLSEDPADRADLTLNSDNRFEADVRGGVDMVGLAGPGGLTLPNLELVGRNGQPAIHGEGTLGNAAGGAFTARTRFTLDAVTRTKGMALLLDEDNDANARTTLDEGARVTGTLDTTVGVSKDLRGAGVRATADLRANGTATDTHVEAGTLTADVPAADVSSRVAFEARFRTTDRGPAIAVRRAAAEATVTVREPGGSVSVATNDGATLRGEVRPGTRFDLETGLMAQPTADSEFLETTEAKVGAHLVLGATSVEYKTLSTALAGDAVVDLNAALGFKVNPAGLAAGDRPLGDDPLTMDLDLTVAIPGGGTLTSSKRGTRTATIRLAGSTRITARTRVTVDPLTGAPTLGPLTGVDVRLTANAIDLRNILEPLGIAIAVSSRTTVRVRKATIEFRDDGVRITHRGISVNIAPGTIMVRR